MCHGRGPVLVEDEPAGNSFPPDPITLIMIVFQTVFIVRLPIKARPWHSTLNRATFPLGSRLRYIYVLVAREGVLSLCQCRVWLGGLSLLPSRPESNNIVSMKGLKRKPAVRCRQLCQTAWCVFRVIWGCSFTPVLPQADSMQL